MDPKRLKDVSLFQGLSGKDLNDLGRWTDEVDIPEGKHLAEQGTFAYEFFVIEDGTADVIKNDEHIATLGPGEFFGEIGLLESERRTATVVATTPMRLIVMTGRDFNAMRSEMPHIHKQVEEKLQERLGSDR
ncbi:MAG TPA: cyclic nucleotide-binding domain-containing protein [Actinomycetota bacterium]|nr:cyclic nucleotide-binding domain-containing protein [Actinomycetota bacterium]